MKKKIAGVAFDLDGTLYPNYRLYIRLLPFIIRECRLLLAFGKARDILRASDQDGGPEGGFYDIQARIMAGLLRDDPAKVKERTERLIYRGWEPLFKGIEPFPHVRETLDAFRDRGIPLGMLSDFPPEQKLKNMGLADYWDVQVCSEMTGRLKPDPASFLELAHRMKIDPDQLLYVGNSVSYDIRGAKQAGMQAALVCSSLRSKVPQAKSLRDFSPEIVFSDYRQLRDFVLG
jgi:putative hydrolase of the HAD superfamily